MPKFICKITIIVRLILIILITYLISCGVHSTKVPLLILKENITGILITAYNENGIKSDELTRCLSLSENETNNIKTISITVTNAQDWTYAYIDLEFPKGYTITNFRLGNFMPNALSCYSQYQPYKVALALVNPGLTPHNSSESSLLGTFSLQRGTSSYSTKYSTDTTPIIQNFKESTEDEKKVFDFDFVLPGDCNQNGKVDFPDFGIIGINYNKDATGHENLDPDKSGKVDFADFGRIGINYNKGYSGFAILLDNTAFKDIEFGNINGIQYKESFSDKGWKHYRITHDWNDPGEVDIVPYEKLEHSNFYFKYLGSIGLSKILEKPTQLEASTDFAGSVILNYHYDCSELIRCLLFRDNENQCVKDRWAITFNDSTIEDNINDTLPHKYWIQIITQDGISKKSDPIISYAQKAWTNHRPFTEGTSFGKPAVNNDNNIAVGYSDRVGYITKIGSLKYGYTTTSKPRASRDWNSISVDSGKTNRADNIDLVITKDNLPMFVYDEASDNSFIQTFFIKCAISKEPYPKSSDDWIISYVENRLDRACYHPNIVSITDDSPLVIYDEVVYKNEDRIRTNIKSCNIVFAKPNVKNPQKPEDWIKSVMVTVPLDAYSNAWLHHTLVLNNGDVVFSYIMHNINTKKYDSIFIAIAKSSTLMNPSLLIKTQITNDVIEPNFTYFYHQLLIEPDGNLGLLYFNKDSYGIRYATLAINQQMNSKWQINSFNNDRGGIYGDNNPFYGSNGYMSYQHTKYPMIVMFSSTLAFSQAKVVSPRTKSDWNQIVFIPSNMRAEHCFMMPEPNGRAAFITGSSALMYYHQND